jgi:hypothetical protein
VIGYGGETINTLRLWSATAAHAFDFQTFSGGDFVASIAEALNAESLTRVLYPDDHTPQGRELRLMQEYFLVACSLADIVRRFREKNMDWRMLPDKAAVQLNDTHPALTVPELMRILLDEAHLGWDEAWEITRRTLAYTNHTLLPEALERWPVEWMKLLIPRQLELIFEINRRLLDDIRARYPGDSGRVARISLVEEAQTTHPDGQSGDRRLPQHQRRRLDTRSYCARRRSKTSPRRSPTASTTRPTASLRGAGCVSPTLRSRERSPQRLAIHGSRISTNCETSGRWPATPLFGRMF